MRLLKSQSDSDISNSYKSYPKISNWYLLKENPSTNLEKIYTSPYRIVINYPFNLEAVECERLLFC